MITVAIWLGREVARRALQSFPILAPSPGFTHNFLGRHLERRDFRKAKEEEEENDGVEVEEDRGGGPARAAAAAAITETC